MYCKVKCHNQSFIVVVFLLFEFVLAPHCVPTDYNPRKSAEIVTITFVPEDRIGSGKLRFPGPGDHHTMGREVGTLPCPGGGATRPWDPGSYIYIYIV